MKRLIALTALALILQPAGATVITSGFKAFLTSGPYAGTSFTGIFAYDDSGKTGVGDEYFGLTAFHFVLKGVAFDRTDIDQGGQVILHNGVYETFTAAIFPPTPFPAPVSDIAFGFGGPGIIGYIAGPDFGDGSFVSIPVSETPEPATAALLLGLLGLTGVAHQRSRRARIARAATVTQATGSP